MAPTAPSPADMTLVRMKHPKLDHPEDKPLPVTTVHAFENIHSKKGWELVDEPVAAVDIESMTKAEIREAYPAATEALPESATKQDLVDAVRASQEG